MSKLTLDEVKTKTLEFLNSKDNADVEHITQELVDKDNASDYEEEPSVGLDKQVVNEIHGHNARYQYSNNVYGFAYERGPNYTGTGCGNDLTRWLPFSAWDAVSIGRCSGNDHKVRFTRK